MTSIFPGLTLFILCFSGEPCLSLASDDDDDDDDDEDEDDDDDDEDDDDEDAASSLLDGSSFRRISRHFLSDNSSL